MLTQQQFEDAKKLIEDYEQQLRQAHVTSRVCMCCRETIISPVFGLPPILKQEQGAWGKGTIALISFGYGSRNDLDSFYAAICDNCINKAEADGVAIRYRSLKKICSEHGL